MTQLPSDNRLPPEETRPTSWRGSEGAQRPARTEHRVALSSSDPEVRAEVLRSAPPGCRELSIPAANRGRFSDSAKTLVFNLTYNDRPATIAVTANENGQLINAYVGGALATVVSERVLMTKKKQRGGVSGPSWNDPMRQTDESGAAPVKTLGENLDDMQCAASAVAKTVLEALDFHW